MGRVHRLVSNEDQRAARAAPHSFESDFLGLPARNPSERIAFPKFSPWLTPRRKPLCGNSLFACSYLCPSWGAKVFKHFQPPPSLKNAFTAHSVGTFVGMLFHNGALSCLAGRSGSKSFRAPRPTRNPPPVNRC